MSRPKKVFLLAVVLLVPASEVVLNLVRGPVAYVVVGNEGTTPIEDLQVVCGRSRAVVAWIAPGSSARVSLAGRQANSLRLIFRQSGNPLGGYAISDFNPAMMSRDGAQLVFNIREGQVERYQSEITNEPMARRVWRWILDSRVNSY
jgi:hypothetical protein